MGNRKQNVGVFGIGAIGSVISFELQKSNALIELSYFGRSPKNAIRLIKGNTKYEVPISLQTSVTKNLDLDWLIVCIKEHQYSDAINQLTKLISPKTKIAVIRNGLRLNKPFLKFTTEANILECTIDCPTQPSLDGFYKSFSNPVISVPAGKLANVFHLLFENSNAEIKQVEDFKTESWKKVCESSALGSILCLSGETCRVFKDEKLKNLYTDILSEGLKVAQADGAKIENDFADKMMVKLLSHPKQKGSSMLTDRINGTQIELGAKNKIISELGAFYGIPTPLNNMIVALLSNTNKKTEQSSESPEH